MNVVQLYLGTFQVNVKYELIKIRRGDSRYTQGVLEVCPKLNHHNYPQGIRGLNGVFETIVHNAPEGVTEIGTP